ncbi:MAG TPA: TRAP transporter substrate-binding protein [Burkholderiales bacterium]|nr:TRAP transporter substrate-binding protein [Burkholderiales bacterium]
MKRREFLKNAGIGVAGGALAAPAAAAQTQPQLRWRMASSFPKSLDTLFGTAEQIAGRVSRLTEGRFEIRVFAAGEIVPPLQVMDAVQNGTVECGQTASYYYIGKNPALAFDTALPFGMNARQQNAWMYHGGGLQLMRDLFKQYNIVNFPAGNTGTQMAGWYRREIKSVADLKGLKMRIAGLAGQILEKLGVVPQQIGGPDIYPALERGTIDAAEWVGPYDDEKLGFHKVAKYYYYPGWWEGSAMLSIYVNAKSWTSLPKPYQEALEVACAEANVNMTARYDAHNTQALRKLVSAGAQVRPFPRPVMEACYNVAQELYSQLSAKSADFKKIYGAWSRFREDQYFWFRVAENTFDNFVYSAKRPAAGGRK